MFSPEVTGAVVEDVKLYTEVVGNEETVGARKKSLSSKFKFDFLAKNAAYEFVIVVVCLQSSTSQRLLLENTCYSCLF